jgi:hypothetical protein
MLQLKLPGAVAILGLLAGATANADQFRYYRDDHHGYYPGQYWSEPQVRLGIDVIWGGFAYAPPRPSVVWYPSAYEPDRYCDRGYDRGHWRGRGRGHRKHDHRPHRWDDSDH